MVNYAIILASGKGERFGSNIPKQFVKYRGKTILEWTMQVFDRAEKIDKIIVVVPKGYKELVIDLIKKNKYKTKASVLIGGKTRKDSSCIAVNSIQDEEANVIIHDAVRPFIDEDLLNKCVAGLEKHSALTVAVPTIDTILEVNNKKIKKVLDRKKTFCCQTPQCFKLSVIKKAHKIAKKDVNFTDDCGIVLKYKISDVYVVEGDVTNIKITHSSDKYFLEYLKKYK